jgi:hypothetical protein
MALAYKCETITVSAFYGCIQRLKPQIIKTKTLQQGSTDINSYWANAHLNWVLQLQICFGKLELDCFDDYKEKKCVAEGSRNLLISQRFQTILTKTK